MISFFSTLSTVGGGAVGPNVFISGDLSALYPGDSHDQLTAKRQSNWRIFQLLCDAAKAVSGTVVMPNARVEMYLNPSDTIVLRNAYQDNLTINGSGGSIVAYPFVPIADLNQNIIDVEYNTTLTINNLTIKRDYIKKYETYSCVLRKGSDPRVIEVLGSIRPEFWDSLSVGQSLFYAYAVSLQGGTKTISSWDSVAKTITVSSDITGVSDDSQGAYVKMGVRFVSDISVSDYNTYGDQWYLNEGMNFLSSSHGTTSTGDSTINFSNVTVSGFENNIFISSPSCKVNFTDVTLSYCQLGMTFFSQSIAGGQRFSFNNLTFSNCAYSIAGGIYAATAGNVLGSGYYGHPSVEIRKIGAGNLYLNNNLGGAFRQYSASGTKPVLPGSYTEFGNIYASGNTEYDLITSNSMPVTIDYIESTGTVNMGGNLTINGGYLTTVRQTAQAQPDAGVFPVATINDCTIKGNNDFGYSGGISVQSAVTYNRCEFQSDKSIAALITSATSKLLQLNLNDCTYVMGSNAGTTFTRGGSINGKVNCGSLIRKTNFGEININNLTTDPLFGYLFQPTTLDYYPSDRASIINITDSDIQMQKDENLFNGYAENQSFKYNLTRTLITSHGIPGQLYPQNATFRSASTTKSIVSSDNYGMLNISGSVTTTLNNVLELDYAYNSYNVNTGTIKVIGPINWVALGSSLPKVIATNIASGSITITAVGGDVVFQKFDATTNPYSNIKNDFTCLSGQSCTVTFDNTDVVSVSPNSNVDRTGATGNGSAKIFSYSFNELIVPGAGTVTAGSIVGTIDSSGNITGMGIVNGKIDLYGGGWYIEFSSAVGNGTPIVFNYDVYSGHRFTGTVTIT